MGKKEDIKLLLKKLQDDEIKGTWKEGCISVVNSFEKSRIQLYKCIEETITQTQNIKESMKLLGEIDVDKLTTLDEFQKIRAGEYKVTEYSDKLVLETSLIPINIYTKSVMAEFMEEVDFTKNAIYNMLIPYRKKVYFERAFVLFQLYTPLRNYDIDNRLFKPYVDAIAATQIIKCDSIDNYCFAFRGQRSESFKMKITIKNLEDVQSVLE